MPGYPAPLAEIQTAPPALIVRGKRALLHRPVLGMAGARNASASACRFARGLAAELGERGVTVAYGLARGIETAAHQGSLEGGTIAVIAGGIDVANPPETPRCRRRSPSAGCWWLSNHPASNLARTISLIDRIIAGLAQAVLVVEAAPRSGSLITARHAGEFSREVQAVPGSPLDPRAQGCNLLIREDATLIQTVDHVLEALRPIDPRASLYDPATGGSGYGAPRAATDAGERIAAPCWACSPSPVPIDEIVRQLVLSPAIVQTVLLELELGGRLERHAGGQVSLG